MLLDCGGGSDDDDDDHGNNDECFLQGWSYSWIVRWRADYRPDRPFPHISHVSPRIATAYREEYFEMRDFI
jgi:hypothetical protein